MDLEIRDHVAIVTGASRGLGRAIATALLGEGMRVVVSARSADDLASLEEQHPGRVARVAGDIASPGMADDLVSTALEAFGRLDAVVNNAGVAPAGRMEKMPLDEWQRILTINVLAPVALMQAAAPTLLGQGHGKVVNIGSLSGLRGKPTLAAYSASKGALARLTEAAAAEWAGKGVQVNMIAPGAFATAAQRAVLDDADILARRVRKIPAGRMGRVEEIGPLACYLVSPLSDFVTGGIYVIDGGEVSKL
jgi:2-deoxy-D-gluconate 3-dehydrogenase